MTAPQRRQRPLSGGRTSNNTHWSDRKSSRFEGQTPADARIAFLDAMRAAGIVPSDPGEIVVDGELHRLHVEGERAGKRNGWAVLHATGRVVAGAFGNWRTGQSEKWHSGGSHRARLTSAECRALNAAIEREKQRREAESQTRHRQVAERARRLWDRAPEVDPAHPYLVRKQVQPHGIRQVGDVLLVPMCDADGAVWNVQRIFPDGEKRFLAGGRKHGLMFVIGEVTDELVIAEGFATGATVRECSGIPAVVAFDCGNLLPVARPLRAKYPAARITFAADNDLHTPGNPGLSKAMAAARAVGGFVALPPTGFNDFNDAACAGVSS